MHIYYPDLEGISVGELVQLQIDLSICVEDGVIVSDCRRKQHCNVPATICLRLIGAVKESRTIEILQCVTQEAGGRSEKERPIHTAFSYGGNI